MAKRLLIGGTAMLASLITAAGVTFAQTAPQSYYTNPSPSVRTTVPSGAPSTGMGAAAIK